MLNARQAFKLAFLRGCAERGLTIPETHAVVKQALADVQAATKEAGLLGDVARTVAAVPAAAGSMLSGAAQTAGPVLAIAPPAVGAAAGLAGAHLTDLNDEDVTDIQTQEKIDAYRRAAEMARASSAQTAQRAAVSGPRRGRTI